MNETNVMFAMGITGDIEEIIYKTDAKLKFKNHDDKNQTVICPINILDGKINEQKKQCHKLVDDMFKAYKDTL